MVPSSLNSRFVRGNPFYSSGLAQGRWLHPSAKLVLLVTSMQFRGPVRQYFVCFGMVVDSTTFAFYMFWLIHINIILPCYVCSYKYGYVYTIVRYWFLRPITFYSIVSTHSALSPFFFLCLCLDIPLRWVPLLPPHGSCLFGTAPPVDGGGGGGGGGSGASFPVSTWVVTLCSSLLSPGADIGGAKVVAPQCTPTCPMNCTREYLLCPFCISSI